MHSLAVEGNAHCINPGGKQPTIQQPINTKRVVLGNSDGYRVAHAEFMAVGDAWRMVFPGGKGAVTVDTTVAGYRKDIFGGNAKYRESATCERLEPRAGGWRGSVVVSFLCGAAFFHEKNLKAKAFDLALVLLGMLFLYIGSK